VAIVPAGFASLQRELANEEGEQHASYTGDQANGTLIRVKRRQCPLLVTSIHLSAPLGAFSSLFEGSRQDRSSPLRVDKSILAVIDGLRPESSMLGVCEPLLSIFLVAFERTSRKILSFAIVRVKPVALSLP
jgi:hypothetical protein